MVAAVLLSAVAISLAFNLLPILRGNADWSWPYRPAPLARLPALVAVAAVYLFAALMVLFRRRAAVAVAFAGAVAISVMVAFVRDGDALWSLFGHVAAQSASGEHWGASVINWAGGEWIDWTGAMHRYLGSVGTSPPGILMLYGGVAGVLQTVPSISDRLAAPLVPYLCTNVWYQSFTTSEWASAWLGILTPVWSALAIFPLYTVARRHAGEDGARMAVLLWPLVPGISAFIASSSTVFPALALIIFDAFERAWSRESLLRWLWVGLLYGVALFLNFVFLPLAAFLGLFALFQRARTGRSFSSLVRPLLVALLGALLPWLAFWAVSGETGYDILAQAMIYQSTRSQSYFAGLWLNIWDWALWSGLLMTGIACAEPVAYIYFRKPLRSIPLSAALAAAILLLSLTGVTRGESGRIWLLFGPFAVIAAARVFSSRPGLRLFGIALCLQALLTFVMLFSIEPHAFGDSVQPPPPPSVAVSRPSDTLFRSSRGEAIRLTGWDAEVAGSALTLSLQFESVAQPLDEYLLGAVFVAPDGTSYGTPPFQPAFDQTVYPTSCWRPGQVIGLRTALTLPADAPHGEWWLSLALFGDSGGVENRFSVSSGESLDVQIGLGPIAVP